MFVCVAVGGASTCVLLVFIDAAAGVLSTAEGELTLYGDGGDDGDDGGGGDGVYLPSGSRLTAIP